MWWQHFDWCQVSINQDYIHDVLKSVVYPNGQIPLRRMRGGELLKYVDTYFRMLLLTVATARDCAIVTRAHRQDDRLGRSSQAVR